MPTQAHTRSRGGRSEPLDAPALQKNILHEHADAWQGQMEALGERLDKQGIARARRALEEMEQYLKRAAGRNAC